MYSGGSSSWRVIGLSREYVGEYADSHSLGRLWKRWIDIVKYCLRKRVLGQASKENCAG